MNMDTDTTKWLKRFIDKDHAQKREIYIEDNERFGRVAFATDGYMMAIARTDEEATGVYHPCRPSDHYPLGWTRVIPELGTFRTNVTVRTEDLARAIMRADVFARHTRHTVHLIIEPRLVHVRAEAHDIGHIETSLDAELNGSPITIALDAKRMLTILCGWARVSNGKRQISSTLDGAEQTIIRVGEPDEIIMIQPADVTAAGRFAMLMPMHKADIDVIEPAYSAHSREETSPADPKPDTEPAHSRKARPGRPSARPGTTPPPSPIVELPPALPAVSSGPVAETKPKPDPEPKPDPVAEADRLTIHPRIELTPARARRIVEHWSAVVEFAQTGTLARENGAKLVHYDTCTVLDLGGKRNKYTQWKMSIIVQHEEVIRAYVEK